MDKQKRIEELKRLIDEADVMVNSFEEQKQRNKVLTALNFELIELEEPEVYEQNRAHFDNYELRI